MVKLKLVINIIAVYLSSSIILIIVIIIIKYRFIY